MLELKNRLKFNLSKFNEIIFLIKSIDISRLTLKKIISLSAFLQSLANIYFNCADLTAIDVGLLLCKIIVVIKFYIATAERLDRDLWFNKKICPFQLRRHFSMRQYKNAVNFPANYLKHTKLPVE